VEEALDHIFELGEIKRPDQRLIVSGCLTARYGKEKLKELLPEVDEFFGIEPYRLFTEEEPVQRILTESPFYAYLKIAEGCNHRCTYCTIPKIRGKYRSLPVEQVVKEAELLLSQGVKEIILVAQDLAPYGRDLSPSVSLLDLLKALNSIEGEFRIRMLYLHPGAFKRDFLEEVLGLEKVVPYFEVPIQHAHPDILKKMGRAYSLEAFLKTLNFLRDLEPSACVRTTVMVGFPGEGEREFKSLLDFLQTARFDYLGVFTFYAEEGTRAEQFRPRVPYKEKLARKREVLKLQKQITKERLKTRVGKEEEVLVLGEDIRGRPFGIARCQAPEIDGITYILSGKKAERVFPGDLIKVKVIKSGVYDLWARPFVD
jgi:ribosomal protein S12 methylthiotransferase